MKTSLYARHIQLGAKIVEFSGWEMPIRYLKGSLYEHETVRKSVGLFDVSHMGRISIEGPDAGAFLEHLSTNYISQKNNQTVTYTIWCSSTGGAIDDVLIFKENKDKYFVVVNAGNREKDLNHMRQEAYPFQVIITPHFDEEGVLALQGPLSKDLMKEIFPEINTLKAMHFCKTSYGGKELFLSRTGYTGSLGFEIFADNESVNLLWDLLLEKGRPFGIEPIGLGARDSLRLEMGYALYGHEINEEIFPSESVAKWAVKLDKPNFLGKDALLQKEKSLQKRTAYGVLLKEGIARAGQSVYKNSKKIGTVTSGNYSPTLLKPIALILVEGSLLPYEEVQIEIRNQLKDAQNTALPFLNLLTEKI